MNVLALIHDDGHVGGLSSNAATDQIVRDKAAAIEQAGITGWRIETLTADDAIARYVAGFGCKGCQIRVTP